MRRNIPAVPTPAPALKFSVQRQLIILNQCLGKDCDQVGIMNRFVARYASDSKRLCDELVTRKLMVHVRDLRGHRHEYKATLRGAKNAGVTGQDLETAVFNKIFDVARTCKPRLRPGQLIG